MIVREASLFIAWFGIPHIIAVWHIRAMTSNGGIHVKGISPFVPYILSKNHSNPSMVTVNPHWGTYTHVFLFTLHSIILLVGFSITYYPYQQAVCVKPNYKHAHKCTVWGYHRCVSPNQNIQCKQHSNQSSLVCSLSHNLECIVWAEFEKHHAL